MPVTDISNFVFFQLINDFLRVEIDTFQWNLLTSTASFVGAVALSLLAIWILFQGFRIVTGRAQQPMMALVGDSLRAVLILSIATGAAGVSSNLYWTLTDGAANAITSLVSHSADSPYANIDKNLAYMQGMLSAIDSLATGGDASTDSAKDRAKWFSGIGIAGPGIIGGSMLLLNKVGIALFVGFGPLFIMCLLFDKTKALFEKWLLYGIGTLFSLAVLSFMVGLANNIVQAVTIAFLAKYAALLAGGDASATEGITSLAMQQGGLGLVLTLLIVSVPPMAAAFFRGVLGQFQAFSAFGAIGRGTERSGHAGHSWREASTTNTTNYSLAGQNGTSGSNAALDYIKNHEWSGMSDTSGPRTPGQRYVELYGGEAPATGAAPDADDMPLTAADWKRQAEVLNKRAEQLSDAVEWARNNGMPEAANEYQQAAIKAHYAGKAASTQAFNMSVESSRNIPQTTYLRHFGADWSYMGANSSGIDANRRGLLTPDYQVVAVSSLSAVGGLARNSHDGTVYLFGGVAQTNPRAIAFEPAATGSVGWILGSNDARSTNKFLSGDANQAFISIPTPWRINFFGAVTHSYGGAYALELGMASPAKVSYGVVPITHSTNIHDPNK